MFDIMMTCLVLLMLFAVVVTACTVHKYRKKLISFKTFSVFIIYAVIICAFGISLALWYKPFYQFSPLHFISVIFFTYSGIILLYGKEKYREHIVWGFMVCFTLLNLARIPPLWLYEGYTFFSILPLHLSGICGVVIIARPFYLKGKSQFAKAFAQVIDNYIIFCAFLAAGMNFFFPLDHVFGEAGFFAIRTIVSNVLHWAFIPVTVYHLLSGEIKPSKKHMLMNMMWLIPAYVILIFVNSFMGTNFFFTNSDGNPILAFYNLFPIWEWHIGRTIVDVNLVYWMAVLAVTIVCLLVMIAAFELINKKYVSKP
jgi:uncharacterized membrane protein YwaF